MVLGPCCCLSEERVIFQDSNRIIGGEQLADGGLVLEHDPVQCNAWNLMATKMFHASNQLGRLDKVLPLVWFALANHSWQ